MSGRRRPPARRTGALELELFAPEAPAAQDVHLDDLSDAGDMFPGASVESAIPVSALTQTAKEIVESAFMPLWVRGEVSDFKAHRNGHWYFCLRDADAQVRCVVWSRDRRMIPAPPDEGMLVTAFGQLSVYAARGDMQFVVRKLEAEGDGLWRKALEASRLRLEREGLLAPERKRPLPRHPQRIAVVTSPDGAALHDIRAVLRRRAPGVELVVVPTAVQGDGAPAQICAALDRVARWRDADTVIIGRGGGAREDLWAFNDEAVARAVAACPLPVISAVGHEIDITLCDLVADWRAPTPSAAAEAAVREVTESRTELLALRRRLIGAALATMDDAHARLQRVQRRTGELAARAVERRRARLGIAAGRLHALSPVATLSRGYSVAMSDDGRTLARAEDFTPGQEFALALRDGRVRARTGHVDRASDTPSPAEGAL